ncbi:hypothetical protein F4804DRAFT_289877 [Jackrogersella minutella]|nr:hypothetical protein F4804DRAFT_289877 [Jackrogersella minutella]
MADARALLRAHRAENRIKHQHAAYSDAGKLLCKLCHEPIKTEALWDSHVQGPNHKKRLQQASSGQTTTAPDRSSGNGSSNNNNNNNKRKLDDEGASSSADDAAEESIPKKRSRPDIATISTGGEKRHSPPVLNRRASNTPLHGVEIAIPSRPATPAAGSNSANSTPKGVPVGRSPLIGGEATTTTTTTPMSISTPTSTSGPSSNNLPISTQALAAPPSTTAAIDEAEWAAFEASIAEPAPGATISAPAVSAAQLAERRRRQAETQVADEREDATTALLAEFEDMEELETRVRRLKDRREALRKGSLANLRGPAADDSDVSMAKSPAPAGRENAGVGVIEEEEEEEDDDDEDEDDWGAFRFR